MHSKLTKNLEQYIFAIDSQSICSSQWNIVLENRHMLLDRCICVSNFIVLVNLVYQE